MAIASVSQKRQRLLYSTDWTQIPNNPLSTAQQEVWATYRQELRDIPQQSGYPFNVVWPIAPT
jgi:DMSO/TMAO reductase YedYZ molybdopterin-dependent catalytic subunit